MEEFKKRLLEFIKTRYGIGQNKFEEYCGLNHGTISSIKVKGPSAEIVAKISNKCPELNLNWLFRGEAGGPMLNPTGEDIIEQPIDKASLKINDVHDNQVVMIGNWEELSNIMESVISKVIVERK